MKTIDQEYNLETRILIATTALVLPELGWLVQHLSRATSRVAKRFTQSAFLELLAWRRLAFRLFLAEVEALVMSYRDISRFKRLVSPKGLQQYPNGLDDDKRWRYLKVEKRYELAMLGLEAAFGLKRDPNRAGRLTGWLADVRAVRRRLAHPSALPDLAPEERAIEQLRRVMVDVVADLTQILDSVVPQEQRPWQALPVRTQPFASLRKFPLRLLGHDWDSDVHDVAARCRDKTTRLVFVTLGALSDDSIWAMRDAGSAVRATQWAGGQAQLDGVLARVLGVTFFGEIEGTCAVLSRAVLYSHARNEVQLGEDDLEWLECATGAKPARQATGVVRETLNLANRVPRSLDIYARAYGPNEITDSDDGVPASVLHAISLRNRTYHPQKLQDIRPELLDYDHLLKATAWFRKMRDGLLVAPDSA